MKTAQLRRQHTSAHAIVRQQLADYTLFDASARPFTTCRRCRAIVRITLCLQSKEARQMWRSRQSTAQNSQPAAPAGIVPQLRSTETYSTRLRRRAPQSELGTALRQQLAANLRRIRTEKGWTQVDLANVSGLGRAFISQVERGHFSVTLETIGALCTALAITPANLISSFDEQRPKARSGRRRRLPQSNEARTEQNPGT